MKSVGMTEPKGLATFVALGASQLRCGLREKVFCPGLSWKKPSKRPGV